MSEAAAGAANRPKPSFPPGYVEERNDTEVYITAGFFLALGTVTLVFRLLSRRYKSNTSWGWDDTLAIPSYIFLAALCGFCIVAVKDANVGRHADALIATQGPKALTPILKSIVALNFLWLLAITLPKLSVLCLYLRVFGSLNKVRYCCYFMMAFVVADFIAFFVVYCVTCRPLHTFWSGGSEHGKCLNSRAVFAASNAPNVFADLGIMLIPLPTLYGLQMPWSKKVGAVVVFLAGSVGLFGSCYRLAMFTRIYKNQHMDYVWILADGLIWSIIESGMCFVAACLIAMKPLLDRALQSRFSIAILGPLGYTSKPTYGTRSKQTNTSVRLDTISKRASQHHTMHSESGWTRLEGSHHAGAEARRDASTDSLVEEGRREFANGVIGVKRDVTVSEEVV